MLAQYDFNLYFGAGLGESVLSIGHVMFFASRKRIIMLFKTWKLPLFGAWPRKESYVKDVSKKHVMCMMKNKVHGSQHEVRVYIITKENYRHSCIVMEHT